MGSLLLLAMASLAGQEPRVPAPAEVADFHHVPGRLPVGRVHRYRKSNLDGSEPSEIALYLADETRLEALKWHPGDAQATLVQAEMDWEVASVRSFRTWRLNGPDERSLVAAFDTTPDRRRLTVKVGELELDCALERFPWHSYDFDLASLNVALPFLVRPEGETSFVIVDPDQGSGGPSLAAKGEVTLAYERTEERSGMACRRYVLDGPGLEDRGGTLWAATGDEVFLVAFEIDLPDEPGMRSGRLEWLRNLSLTQTEWQAFVRTRAEPERR